MEEATQTDSNAKKADNKDTGVKGKDVEDNLTGPDVQEEKVSGTKGENTQTDKSVSGRAQTAETAATPQPTVYKSVDIRL